MPNWKKVVVSGSDAALNNITASGDVHIFGNLTAQQYIISSSVSYVTQSFSSGSTIFGDTLDDTHQFTGSLFISGNLTLNDGDVTINGVGPLTGLTSSYISSSFNNNIIDFFKASGVNDQIDLSSIINASGDDDWHIASANLLTSSYNVEISGTLGVSESISTPDLNLLGDGSPEIIADGVLTLSSSQTVVVSSSALIVENGIVADSITASISSSNIEGNLFLFTDGTSQGDITFNENNVISGITVIASASGLRTTDNVTFNDITASNIIYAIGNISSSGNLYGNDKLYLYDKAILNYTPNIFKIGLGTDNSQGYQRIEIGHSTISITASGDILASEDVRIEGQTIAAGISASGFLHANLQEDSAGSYNNTVVYDTDSGRFFYTGSYGSGISLDSLNNFTGSIQTEVDNLTNVTGSYAVTASNIFTDSQTIQGNITASGNISASGLLFASTSDASGQPYLNVLINTSSGQFYYTSSITTNNSNINTINNLKVQGNPIWKVTESVVTSYNDLTGSGITLDEGDLLFTNNAIGGTYYAVLRTIDYTGKNHDNPTYWTKNNINAYLKYTETSSGAFKRRKINSTNEPERYTIGVATPPNARIIFNLGSNPGIEEPGLAPGDIAGGIVSGSITVGDIVTVDLDKNDNVNLLYTPNVTTQNLYYGPNGALGANNDWNYIDLIAGTNDGATFLGINPTTAITGGASFDLKQTGYSLQPVISRSADLELRQITASLLSVGTISASGVISASEYYLNNTSILSNAGDIYYIGAQNNTSRIVGSNIILDAPTSASIISASSYLQGTHLYVDDYIYHNGDPDTSIKFNNDQILINVGSSNSQAQFGTAENKIGNASDPLDLKINSNKVLIESGIIESSNVDSTVLIDNSGQLYKTSSAAIVPNTASYALTSSHALYSSHSFTLSGSTNLLVNSDSTYLIDGTGGITVETTEGSFNNFRTAISINTSSLDTQINNLNSVTGSYAVTASNTFTDSQTIQGNITASGNISASGYISASTSYFVGLTGIPTLTLDHGADQPHIQGSGSLWLESNNKPLYLNVDTNQNMIFGKGGGTVAIGDYTQVNVPSGPLLVVKGNISSSGNLNIENNITALGNISASGNLLANVTDSSNTGYKTVVYDTATGQFYRTGSYGGGGGGGSDNLGNHTATQDLDLDGNNITNVSSITTATNSDLTIDPGGTGGLLLKSTDIGIQHSGVGAGSLIFYELGNAQYTRLQGQTVASNITVNLPTSAGTLALTSDLDNISLTSITASSDISASGLLFAGLSEDTAGSYNNTVVYDTTTGQLYYTGSYGSGGGGGGSGTVTQVTVGTGLDVTNGTTTPNITLDLTEITLSSGLDSTTTGLSLDLTEVIANDTANRVLTTDGDGTLTAEDGITSPDGKTFEFNVGDAAQGAFGFYTDLVNDIEPTSAVDIFIGNIVDLGSTTSTTKGKIYNLSGSWGPADAADENKSSYLLGIATATGASNNRFMLKGYCSIPSSYFSNDTGIVVGSPIYLDSTNGGTAGQYDFKPPSTGDTSRIVGHLVDIYNISARGAMYKIYFNPSPEWIVL